MTQNKILPVLLVALLGAFFMIGRLSAQVEGLTKGSTPKAQVAVSPTPSVAAESPISVSNLKLMAAGLGLNKDQFNKCLDDGKFAQKVKDDSTYGSSVGVNGTPHFVINGIEVVGALPEEMFTKIIDAELKDKSGLKVAMADKITEKTSRVEVKKSGHITGADNAKIRMVEFSDFECPYCVRAFPTIKSLEAKYGEKLSLEYFQYPLPFHPNAQKAAEASECAAEQGKFWEMHDKLFEASAVAQQ